MSVDNPPGAVASAPLPCPCLVLRFCRPGTFASLLNVSSHISPPRSSVQSSACACLTERKQLCIRMTGALVTAESGCAARLLQPVGIGLHDKVPTAAGT